MPSRSWIGTMLAALAVLLLPAAASAQASRLEHGEIDAASIRGNPVGISSLRRVAVYLPPAYADADRRFPVIYYFSSFFEDEKVPFATHGAQALFDRAISEGVIGDFILVTADVTTPMGGSWLTNSTATGRWEDFAARELVGWVDARYRTAARAESRGVAGDRMGAYGAIRLGMRHPDVFGAVYGLHPIGAGLGLQPMFSRPNWDLLQRAQSLDALKEDGFSLIFTSIFQAHLPNPGRAPLFFDPPARKVGDRLEVDAALAEKLYASFALDRQVGPHADGLKRLRGLMFDWARGDANADHIVSLQALTRVLDGFGVPYEAEEYRGGWGERHWGAEGRVYTRMLPFFARHLAGAAKR